MGDDSKKSRSKSASRQFKSRNPFINFLQEFLRAYRLHEHKKPSTQLFKLAGERWKQMTQEEKAPYIKAAREAEKPKAKPSKKLDKKKHKKRSLCCSRCGHRPGSPISNSANESVESIWTIKPVDRNSSRNSASTSTGTRSRTITDTTVTDGDYTDVEYSEDSTTWTSD